MLSAFIDDEYFAKLGLSAGAAAAFQDVAAARAPALAGAYADAVRAAGGAARPGWPAPWPPRFEPRLSFAEAGALCLAGLDRLDPALGVVGRRLWRWGRVRPIAPAGGGAGLTTVHRRWMAAVRVRFDGGGAGAATLAHELGHAVQMSGAWGLARPAPPLAAAELAAQVAEAGLHAALCAAEPLAGAARRCADHLALLVRHPARDAARTLGWPAAAARFAPALDWSGPPAAPADDGRALVYALAAALALPLSARLLAGDAGARAGYRAFLSHGPKADLDQIAALLGGRLNAADLYHRAYDQATAAARAAERMIHDHDRRP